MNNPKRRILLLGDASNCHNSLATGLKRLGHDVDVASSGSSFMNTHRDIDLRRRLPWKLGGLDMMMRAMKFVRDHAKDYDIISVKSPLFLDLRPHRCRYVFDELLKLNSNVFMTHLATDTFYIDACFDPNNPFRYNEWIAAGEYTSYYKARPDILEGWTSEDMRKTCENVYGKIKGTTPVLYEYHMTSLRHLPPEKVGDIGIPIDTSAMRFVPPPERIDRVKILLGRHSKRMSEKGTDMFEVAAKAVVDRYPTRAQLDIVEDLSFYEYIERQEQAHLLLDQVYSYTPATNALQAMAMGKNVVTGGEPEYYDFIGEKENRPIINVTPDYESIERAIEQVILHPEQMAERGKRSREFVVKHNDTAVVTQRAINFWESRISEDPS